MKDAQIARRHQLSAVGAPRIVGIGASAGGLEAFTELLRALPIDTGLSFVLVQHLEPKHRSILSTLLSRATTMPVCEADDRMQVEPNHVYVIPPNSDLDLFENYLRVVRRQAPAGRHTPIDHFFQSLTESRGSQAIGVILSGTGSDGTAGIKAMKEAGGITFAQDTESAKFEGMPRNAIESGYVDISLPPARMAHELARLARHPLRGPVRQKDSAVPAALNEWSRLFRLLLKETGVDFSLYKQSTVRRRLARRMTARKVGSLSTYLKLLERDEAEAHALFDELLIPVTEFFRDSDVFLALRGKVFPNLLSEKPTGEPIRIWVMGCSTGEEVYSIAITLIECLGDRVHNQQIQIFGTDVNQEAIKKARLGIFPASSVKGIAKDRVRRYFTPFNGTYQINQDVREICVFARHDPTRDPPFSKLDMVSCRNVLIYMEPALQKRILSGFHWALRAGGILLIGKSESLGAQPDLFSATDRKNKFFRRAGGARVPLNLPLPAFEHAFPARQPLTAVQTQVEIGKEVDQVLWERSGCAALVVNSDLAILHVRGDTSPYVRLVPGKASLQLMRVLREEIVLEIRSALQKARADRSVVRSEGIHFHRNGVVEELNIEVRPLVHIAEPSFLILFERGATKSIEDEPSTAAGRHRPGLSREVSRLRNELTRTREYMQAIVREQEATNEELKNANEEAHSNMEELQSTNEELETAKEELQSSNEELITLNEQLRDRNSELSQLSIEISNVLSGVDIPIVILGPDSRIRRFTPSAENLLGLISADVGQSISKLRLGIKVPKLDKLIANATKKGEIAMVDVQSTSGRWYSLRVRPFIAPPEKVQGVLLAFVDINDVKKLQEHETGRADQSESVTRALLENAAQAILAIDKSGGIKLANLGAEKMFGYSRDALAGKQLESLLPERFRARHAQHRESWFAQARNRAMGIGLDLAAIRKNGTEFPIEVGLSSIHNNNESLGVAFISDITERKKAERALIDYRDRLAAEVSALERLRETSEHLWRLHDLRSGLQQMIDAGVALLGADMGSIQLLDKETQALKIVAQRGFGADFLQYFREVSAADESASGRSLRNRQRIVIEDVNADPKFAPHRAAAAAAGYRAVQSTPLFDSNGELLGTFSTHFRDPHRSTEEELSRFDLYAHQAAQFIERIKSDERLKGLTGALLQMQESGNQEVARELHDVFSQELVGVGMEVASFARDGKSKEEIQRLTELSKKIMLLADDIHSTARELHPAVLEDLGLVPALQQECESFKKTSGIAIHFRPQDVPSAIPKEVALCLYRVAQESLRNIRKHAANTDSVLVSLEGHAGGLALRVQDSGDGFELSHALSKGLGLVSMEERVRLVNGRFAIDSAPAQGTTVQVVVPLNGKVR